MKLTADQFDTLCDAVRDCIGSLAGCKRHEIARESVLLQVTLSELCHAELIRRNEQLINRRRDLIARAGKELAGRTA